MNKKDVNVDANLGNPKISTRNVNVFYGEKQAINNVSIDVDRENVTAFIGPSGCGKSTFLRTLNRMNDTVIGARVEGEIMLDGLRADLGLPARAYGDESHKPDGFTGLAAGQAESASNTAAAPTLRIAI
eukprot:gene61795-biopygen44920